MGDIGHKENRVNSGRIRSYAIKADGAIPEGDVDVVAKAAAYALHGPPALFFSGNGLAQQALFNDPDQWTGHLLVRRESP